MSANGPASVPYGSWPSPVTARMLVQGSAGISEVIADPIRPWQLWWAESRPDEGGRTAVMRCDLRSSDSHKDNDGRAANDYHEINDGRAANDRLEILEITPSSVNVRTCVHEYGGAGWWPHDGSLFYVNYTDQRLWRLDASVVGQVALDRGGTGGAQGRLDASAVDPIALTAEPPVPRAWRFADGRNTPDGRWCVCVRERHDTGTEPANELVAVDAHGSLQQNTLWSGADFVMTPRVSPDGTLLAWISWDHPNMGWTATRLHVHRLGDGELGAEVLVLGLDGDRSLCEPGWLAGSGGVPDRLLVCSDHDDWWGLYEVDFASGTLEPAVVGDFDVATPPWVFGMQRWAATDTVVAAVAGMPSGDRILLNGSDANVPDSSISSLTIARDGPDGCAVLAYAGAGFGHETEVVTLPISGTDRPGGRAVVRPSRELGLDPQLLAAPEAITFPTGTLSPGTLSTGTFPTGDYTPAFAHALYYRPANPDCVGTPCERPPLLVTAHGGPTAAARRQLQLGITYWTSRGIAVVDVDYRGSTGYGRSYRRALDGSWGVADVQDCVAAARFLVDRGDVDGDRLMIRGGSAGGFTVLAALAFHDVFSAGASRYGIADLEALAADTHKFESRYLDLLVGPYPEAKDIYVARSPIHHLDGFKAPMIVLQGDEDAIVPPAQSEMIVEALRARGVPVCYLLFKGEQHGFRSADNIVRALEAELAFFGKILGFSPAEELPDVEIDGLQ